MKINLWKSHVHVHSVCATLVLLTAFVAPSLSEAATYQWKGTSSSTWSTAANWSNSLVGPTGGSFSHRLNVTNPVAGFDCVYDGSLGTTVYGAVGTRGLVVGSSGNGNFRLTGGVFATTNGTPATTDVVSGPTGGTATFTNDGGTYVSWVTQLGLNNVNSGTLTMNSGSTVISNLQYAFQSPGSGTVNLNGGTFTVSAITRTSGGTAGTHTLNLNGGIMVAGLANGAFIANGALSRINVRNGGARIDTAGFDITIAPPLFHSNIGGDAATDGGLTKQGAGTLTLSSAGTYTGPTVVSGGRLALSLPSSSLALTNFTGTTNTLALNSGSWSLAAAALTNTTFNFNYTPFAGDTNTVLNITNLTVSGTITLNVPAGPAWVTGNTYKLITYGTLSGSVSAFALGTVAGLSSRQTAALVTTGNDVAIQIGGDKIVWTGAASGNWTSNAIGTPFNWKLLSSGAATEYFTGDTAIFNDTASTGVINISTTNVSPSSLTFSNDTLSYTISSVGGYGITGGSITKNGAATLTLTTSNSYAGATIINGGTLQVSSGSAIANSGIVTLANAAGATLQIVGSETIGALNGGGGTGGTVTIDAGQALTLSSGSQTFAGTITGSGNLTNAGALQTLTGSSPVYAGTVAVSSGALVVSANDALGSTAAGTTISPNTSLGLSNGVNYGAAEQITGSGVGTTVANTGPFVAVQRGMVQSVSGNNTFAGDIEINASGTTRFGGQDGAQLTLSGAITRATGVSGVTVLFRTGTANGDFVTLTNPGNSWDNDTQIFSGNNGTGGGVRLGADNALPTTVGVVAGGNSTGSGTALDFAGFNQTLNGLPNSNGRLHIWNSSGTLSTLTLNLTTANKSTFAVVNLTTIEDGPGAGKVAVVKTGGFAQTLFGAHTYTGDTTISNGTLAVDGSLAAGSAVYVYGGSLGGSGTVNGPVTVAAGGSIAPGLGGIATLTLGAAPSLGGTLRLEINRNGGSPLADKLAGVGALGGTLTLTNVGATLQAGDTFDLLDGSLSGSFGTLNLPGGVSHWSTTDLNVGGTITFNGNNPPSAANIDLGVAVGGSVTAGVVAKYCSDADTGDTLTIISVSPPANGTVAIVGGTNIIYTSTNSAASDSFTYTVSDGLETDTATVTVLTYSPEGFNRLSPPSVIGAGTVVLSYLGIPGCNYALDWATNLTPPITWVAVITNTAESNGSLSYIHTSTEPVNFFRTRSVP